MTGLITINLVKSIEKNKQFYYRKGNVMECPRGPNHFLLHASNCKGAMGKGVALEIALTHPSIFKENKKYCWQYQHQLRGSFREFADKNRNVTFLYTSDGWGKNRDPKELIIQNTIRAISVYLWFRKNHKNMVIHSPRINFGLFGIPWTITANIIKSLLPYYPNITWVVWIPERKGLNDVQFES